MSQDLAARGCSLIMVCRNEQRGQEAMQKIIKETGNNNVQLKVCKASCVYTWYTHPKEKK